VRVGDFAVRRVGNNERPSPAGVDVPGAAFLLPDSFQTDGVVFAFAAYYRNSNPIRFQLWRPVQTPDTPSVGDFQTAAPPPPPPPPRQQRPPSSETVVQLLAQLTVTPSVKDSRETVRMGQGRGKDFSLGGMEDRRTEGREGGAGFLGTGQQPPPHQLGGLGERCELPSGVRGEARQPKGFPLFSALTMASPDTIILLIVDYHVAIGWAECKQLRLKYG